MLIIQASVVLCCQQNLQASRGLLQACQRLRTLRIFRIQTALFFVFEAWKLTSHGSRLPSVTPTSICTGVNMHPSRPVSNSSQAQLSVRSSCHGQRFQISGLSRLEEQPRAHPIARVCDRSRSCSCGLRVLSAVSTSSSAMCLLEGYLQHFLFKSVSVVQVFQSQQQRCLVHSDACIWKVILVAFELRALPSFTLLLLMRLNYFDCWCLFTIGWLDLQSCVIARKNLPCEARHFAS